MFTTVVDKPSLASAPKNPEAQLAIVLYSKEMGGYAALHSVKNNKLQQGKLTDLGSVRRILSRRVNDNTHQVNQQRDIDNELVPEKVLVNAPDLLVWHTPRQKRPMWFNSVKDNLDVWWPSLVFAVKRDGRSLTVRAKATDSRPTSNTRLYHAPLMNISHDGSLCQGGAQLPTKKTFAAITEMENTLFDSYFTHLNWQSRKPLYQTSEHIRKYRHLAATEGRVKATDMVRAGTMGEWLNTMMNGGR